jgi:hypothetical protein
VRLVGHLVHIDSEARADRRGRPEDDVVGIPLAGFKQASGSALGWGLETPDTPVGVTNGQLLGPVMGVLKRRHHSTSKPSV